MRSENQQPMGADTLPPRRSLVGRRIVLVAPHDGTRSMIRVALRSVGYDIVAESATLDLDHVDGPGPDAFVVDLAAVPDELTALKDHAASSVILGLARSDTLKPAAAKVDAVVRVDHGVGEVVGALNRLLGTRVL